MALWMEATNMVLSCFIHIGMNFVDTSRYQLTVGFENSPTSRNPADPATFYYNHLGLQLLQGATYHHISHRKPSSISSGWWLTYPSEK